MTKLLHWAPNLGEREKRAIHVVERGLYLYLLMMPLSGFVFVMAGDFGVHFFNTWHLPKVVGPNDTLALAVESVISPISLTLTAEDFNALPADFEIRVSSDTETIRGNPANCFFSGDGEGEGEGPVCEEDLDGAPVVPAVTTAATGHALITYLQPRP